MENIYYPSIIAKEKDVTSISSQTKVFMVDAVEGLSDDQVKATLHSLAYIHSIAFPQYRSKTEVTLEREQTWLLQSPSITYSTQ